MSRGTEGLPRVSGRVESPQPPRPDTATDDVLTTIRYVILTAVGMGCLLYIPGWIAGLI